jgi:hypothetical protein
VPRQIDFLTVLARTSSITEAARAVGMSRESAHRLRNREPNGLFAASWDRALGADRSALTRAEIVEGHIQTLNRALGTEAARLPRNLVAQST